MTKARDLDNSWHDSKKFLSSKFEHKTLSKSRAIILDQHVKLNYHYLRIKQIEWNAIKEVERHLKRCFMVPPCIIFNTWIPHNDIFIASQFMISIKIYFLETFFFVIFCVRKMFTFFSCDY